MNATAGMQAKQAIPTPTPRNRRWVPIAASLFFGAIVLVNAVLSALGAATTGATADDSTYFGWHNTYRETGWYVYPDIAASADPLSSPDVFTHGPVMTAVGWLVTQLLGIQSSANWEASPATIAVNHILVSVVFCLSILAVFVATRRLLASVTWGLAGAALYSSMPVLLGHSMINIMDAPVAFGFTMTTAGLAIAVADRCRRGTFSWVSAAFIAAGTFLAIGTRPAVWPVLVASLAVGLVLIFTLSDTAVERRRLAWGLRSAVAPVVSFLAGAALAALIYPKALANPLPLIISTVSRASTFPFTGDTLTNGELVPSSETDASYLSAWLVAQTPIFYSLLALIGSIAAIGWLVPRVRRRLSPWSREGAVLTSLYLAQAVIPAVAALMAGAVLYNGTRHLLMVSAAIPLVALGGASLIWSHARNAQWRSVLLGGFVVCLTWVTVTNVLLLPYNYAYFNPVVAHGNVNGRWETDGWWISRDELSSAAIAQQPTLTALGAPQDIRPCFFNPPVPSMTQPWKSVAIGTDQDRTYVCKSFGRPYGGERCRVVAEVSRPLLGGPRMGLSQVYACDFPVPDERKNKLSFAGSGPTSQTADDGNLLWGWGVSPDQGTYAAQPTAGVGIRALPSYQPTRAITIDGSLGLVSQEPETLGFWVNGRLVGQHTYTSSQGESVRISLPADERLDATTILRIGRLPQAGEKITNPLDPLFFYLGAIQVE